MIKRIFSTVALWALVIGLLYLFGATGAVWLIALFTVATQYELYRLFAKMGYRPFAKIGCLFGALIILAPFYLDRISGYLPDYLAERFDANTLPGILIVIALFACALRILRERGTDSRVETLATTLFGLVYVPFLLQFYVRLILLYQNPDDGTLANDGLIMCLWLIAVAKFCDVGALITGLTIGRHKMAPEISPLKTWEGAAGGVFFSVVVGTGLAWGFNEFLPDYTPEALSPFMGAVMALPIALTGILSDLVKSMIKRRADLKDSGAIIPGIGGAFDLTDSLILTAPLGYMLCLFLL